MGVLIVFAQRWGGLLVSVSENNLDLNQMVFWSDDSDGKQCCHIGGLISGMVLGFCFPRKSS